MFKRYPYWGWLLLSILLWCATGYHYYTNRLAMQPPHMTRLVTRDLQKREKAYDEFAARKDLLNKLFADTLTGDEESYMNRLPFYVYAYSKDTLAFWNTNDIVANAPASDQAQQRLIHNDRGVYLQYCIAPNRGDTGTKIIVLLPIVTHYPLENEYLRSRFLAADYIPVSTQVVASAGKQTMEVDGLNGKPAFYLAFKDIPHWMPDAILFILLIASVLASLSWLQLMTIYLTRNRSPFIGLTLTLVIIIFFRGLIYLYGLPFNLDSITFFSPSLFASNKFLPSLGDLFLNTLCVLWIVVFVTRHVPYKTIFNNIRSAAARYGIAAALFAVLVEYVFLFVDIIRKLVIDSSISFDVSHFYSINIYTILGLFVIGIITCVSCIIVYLFNTFVNSLVENKWLKYGMAAVIGIILLFTSGEPNMFNYLLVVWLVVFIFCLDVKSLVLVSDLFEPRMVFWAVFICAFCTGVLQYFNHEKERDSRIYFARQKITPQQDNETEFVFDKVTAAIQNDKLVNSFFGKPAAATRRSVDARLESQYLTGPMNKYQSHIYLFDRYGRGLFNKDNVNYDSLVNELNESSPTNSSSLFYKESILDRHYYLAYIEVRNDTTGQLQGSMFIDLDLKKATNEAVYPELLQPTANKVTPNDAEYSYALYINDRLVSQTNDYPFPIYLKDTLPVQRPVFFNKANASELWYRIADKRTVVAVHYHNVAIETLTLFSYLFGIQVMLAIIVLVYQLYLSSFINPAFTVKFTRLTLRRRVHFSMLFIVLFSFVVIGFVTIFFLKSEYKSTNTGKLERTLQAVKQSIQEDLMHQDAYNSETTFDTISRSASFNNNINKLAVVQRIDINVYDNNGTLVATSQEDIYDRSLLARVMRPDAYYQLQVLGKSIVIQDEKAGNLSYLSAYLPLRDERGVTLGYINIPFFSSERELNFQISNIVVTLINLYAFIFLLSGVITVFITRWLTKTFNVIISQFSRLNLQRNERIEWPYEDEIGTLVREYNKMVKKVEENAALLAQSERESAWREMARQVAHEIKNPLTPMKLNIQYLQQALKQGHANVKDLAGRVTDSLIEQIDNLSYIASEFSNFAKMPEARPENLELNELLGKAVELYMNEPDIRVMLSVPGQAVVVYADRSQMLRVFTNLLENAKQAISNGVQGLIEVSLKEEDGYAIISVADNGEGMTQDVVKRIFQPYFTTKSSGTGLGLAMTRKIIEFWKGQIWFETEEGKGSIFYIRMPVADKSN